MPGIKIPLQKDDPRYWRSRAEEARIVADELTHAHTKQVALRIAEDYERMARIAEAQLRKKTPS